ncbi:MAG: Pyridoxal phosphate biosynthetic protein PdxJ [Gammaproteobacteria bacterium]|nr:Pyridoxal phosphate biosynthetic protein PdxJ [Gammaproteobacteria bacterium]
MSRLSVNLNKIALLRNSRGHDYPNLIEFAKKALAAGAHGITIHPRPDQRHATYGDVRDLSELLTSYPQAELNIEGYPDDTFMEIVLKHRPDQVTLVPDAPKQLTSDHGWDLREGREFVGAKISKLRQAGIRSSLFLDPDPAQIGLAAAIHTDRIELYTEAYAAAFGGDQEATVLDRYRRAAVHAQQSGLGVNAGHDLNLDNLGRFLGIPGILEVSIGHALTVEALDYGYAKVIGKYLQIIGDASTG